MVCFYSGVDSFEGSGTMLLAFPGLKKIQDNASMFGNILIGMEILVVNLNMHYVMHHQVCYLMQLFSYKNIYINITL